MLQANPITKVIALLSVAFLLSLNTTGQNKKEEKSPELTPERLAIANANRPPSGAGFYIGPIDGPHPMFNLLLTDDGGRSVTGSFTPQQVEVFEAVLESASAFALTEEAVGDRSPIITRLMDQHEWSLFVDVAKLGKKSRFYVSLMSVSGRLTADGGEITRGSKEEPKALLFKILSQVRDARTGVKPQQ